MKNLRLLCVILLSIGIAACVEVKKESYSPQFQILQQSGMSERAINQLLSKSISDDEIDGILLMRNAGTSDRTILQLIDRSRKDQRKFTLGEDVAKLRNSGMSDPKILEVEAMGALPDWTEEMVKMRNAGISDSAIAVLANMKFTQKKSVVSGDDISRMKQTGMSETAIIHLIENGLTSVQVQDVEKMRHRGISEDEVIMRLK